MALYAGDFESTLFTGLDCPLLLRTLALSVKPDSSKSVGRLRAVHSAGQIQVVSLKQKPASNDISDIGRIRLAAYLRLIAHLNMAPWASGQFNANSNVLMRMISSHMRIITNQKSPDPKLYTMLDGSSQFSNARNVIWITNRQQGKTTLIGKFLASLVLSARCGGVLACVYSTKMDRAAELVKAAKDYLEWVSTPAGSHDSCRKIVYSLNNQREFTVRIDDRLPVTVVARPRNADACRGDAPHCAFFDEIAFASSQFWYQFAMPLLQIDGRVFTCTTTPPPPGTFFDIFCQQVKRTNRDGDSFFSLINHSLACENCIERLEPDKCCHRFHYVPPWKSLLSLSAIGRLMPKSRSVDFAAEVFGVMRSTFNGYLPSALVHGALDDNPGLATSPYRSPVIWVGIDPPSHNRSEMGLIAILAHDAQILTVVGASSVNASQCQVMEIMRTVELFIDGLRKHPWGLKSALIIPVIECNNNEILSSSLLHAVCKFQPVFMPFTKQRFKRFITPGVGIWTTHDTTLAALSTLHQHLLENRITVARIVVTVGRQAFDEKSKSPSRAEIIKLLADQLCQFTDDKDGKITGKTADGLQDDLGMAMLLAVYWRLAVLVSDGSLSA